MPFVQPQHASFRDSDGEPPSHLKQQTVEGMTVLEAQLLTRLFLNSDNTAQHLKSSNSLRWLSKLIGHIGFLSVLWDFGQPGHGKVMPLPLENAHVLIKVPSP